MTGADGHLLKSEPVGSALGRRGSGNAMGLPPAPNQQARFIPERYVPSAKDMKQLKEFLDKMNHPSWHFGPKDALAPTTLELSGFATAVDANGNSVQSPNIDIKVL